MRSNWCLLRSVVSSGALLFASASYASPAEPSAHLVIPDVLNLSTALELLRKHGLDLLVADAAVESARGELKLASAAPNPVLSGTLAKSFAYDANGPLLCPPPSQCADLGFSVGLSDQALWDVVTGKRGLRILSGNAALLAARFSRQEVERNLVFAVQKQVVTVALAQRVVEFAAEAVASAHKTVELDAQRFAAGASSEVQLAKAQTEELQAQQQLDIASYELRVQKISLAFLLGARASTNAFSVDFPLEQPSREPPASTAEPSESAKVPSHYIELAMQHRPDLLAQEAQKKRAQAELKSAYRQRVPDVSLGLSYQQQGTGPAAIQPPTLSFATALTLPIWNFAQGSIHKGLADVAQQDYKLEKIKAQIVVDVESSYAALALSEKLRSRLESGLLQRAQRTRDLYRLRYEKGAASLLEYLDAQRVYIATYKDYFQALAGYWTARFQLEQALGL